MAQTGDILTWDSTAAGTEDDPKAKWQQGEAGGKHAIGGSAHDSDTIANIRTKCSDATIETTAGSAAAVSGHESAYTHANLPKADEKAALAGTSGTPSVTNKYATDADARMTNARTPTAHNHAQSDVTNLTTDLAAKALASDLSTHTGYTTTAHGGLLPSTSFSGLARITVGTSAPVNPASGDLWIDCY